jgi:hypothetical protein
MKTSDTGNFRSIVGKVMTALVLAALIGSVEVTPALAKDHDNHNDNRGGQRHDNRRNEHRGHGGGHDRGRYEGSRVYRSYGYAEPVYVAPPVYYAPPPAPGISIFLPTIHIR